MILFPSLTIYSIVKRYASKENTANILLLIIFLYTQSYFTAFNFTMNSRPIIVFYFGWRILENSLAFQLSSLASLKRKNWKLPSTKKRAISKTSINGAISFNFKIVYMWNKNCKNKSSKTKIVVSFTYSSFTFIFTLIFHFHSWYSRDFNYKTYRNLIISALVVTTMTTFSIYLLQLMTNNDSLTR